MASMNPIGTYKAMRNILIFIVDLIIAFVIICSAIYGEYIVIYPFLNSIFGETYSDWTVLILIVIVLLSFWGLAVLNGKIVGFFLQEPSVRKTSKKKIKLENRETIFEEEEIRPIAPLLQKPLGGYRREQLNEIYLLGIIIHQLYLSNIKDDYTEKQGDKLLCIQKSFFITVFSKHNEDEYFEFTKEYMDCNNNVRNLSITDCMERSVHILSTCNIKQIQKLCNLYKTLSTRYMEIDAGDKRAMSAFVDMLEARLQDIIVKYKWDNFCDKKKR